MRDKKQRPLTVRERQREQEKARRAWDALDKRQQADLGDALVLGTFDWIDWFDVEPSGAFMNELGRLFVLEEC